MVATADDSDNNTAYTASARNATVSHALNGSVFNDSRYNEEFFYGVMIDTGCARASSGGLSQYRAYCRHIGATEKLDTSRTVFCKFGISGKVSIGLAEVKFPINEIILSLNIHIIDDDVPLLLSLADMDRLGIFYNNLNEVIVHEASAEMIRLNASTDIHS